MREIAGVGKTGENVRSRHARVVGENFVLRLAGCQEFQSELDSETRPAGLPARISGSTTMRSDSGITQSIVPTAGSIAALPQGVGCRYGRADEAPAD